MNPSEAASNAPWDLLARHLAGEATPAEQAELRAWAARQPEHQALLNEAARAWQQAGALPAPAFSPNLDQAWQRFESQVWGAPPAPASSPAPAPSTPLPSPAGWLAGLVKTAGLVAVGVGAGWYLNSVTPDPTPRPASSGNPAPAAVGATADSAARQPAGPAPAADTHATRAADAAADLVFDNAPLPEVVEALERRFGTRVVLTTAALQQCRFTGSFQRPHPEQVLRVVSMATSTTLTQRPDGAWELRGNGCDPARL